MQQTLNLWESKKLSETPCRKHRRVCRSMVRRLNISLVLPYELIPLHIFMPGVDEGPVVASLLADNHYRDA